MQHKSQSERPKSQSEATKLLPKQTEPNGPESQKMGTKLDIKYHDEISEKNSQYKLPMLTRYVRRHNAPNQIIGDKLDGTMTRNKLKGTCLLAAFEPRNVKDSLDNES